MIVLKVYNSKTYVNKGLSKSTRAKNMVTQMKKNQQQQKEERTAAEKLAYVYSGREIDLRDPNGFYLMNSGLKIKTQGGLGRIESKAFTALMDDLFQQKTFEQLAQAITTPEAIMNRAIDLNEKLNASTAQKTKTFSSIEDLRQSYDYYKDIRDNKGKLYIFDTETIGGKNRTGIWTPAAITEFAMQEYDFATGKTINTNIVMGIAENEHNQRIHDDIVKYIQAKNWAAIEQNEELYVTAKRAGLYANAEMEIGSRGFYEITSLGDSRDEWKNLDNFEAGWKKLTNAYKTTGVSDEGLKYSDKAFIDSVFDMQIGMKNNTAMVLGQNIQIFDEPIVNMQLKKTLQFYQEILNDTSGGLATTREVSKANAQKAVDYINNKMIAMGGGLNLENRKTFDTLPMFKVGLEYFGADALYNNNAEAKKAAIAGLAKQEYVGAAWFPDLFENAMAHMADFDVSVLNLAATRDLGNGKGTLIDYIMSGMGEVGTGIYGIQDNARKIRTGQMYYSRKGTSGFDFAGKGMLNFTHNAKTGEIFTSSGYKIINGQSVGYEDTKINMGTNLTKGHFFTLESIKKVSAKDIHASLGDVMPDMAGTDFIVAQFKMALPEGVNANGLEDISYNFLFNSEKQFSGFMSYDMQMAVDYDENGEMKIVSGMEDLFDMVEVDPYDGLVRKSQVIPMTDKERVQEALKNSYERYRTNKAYDSVLDSEDSYKNIKKMMKVKDVLAEYKIEDNISSDELRDLLDGKKIRNLKSDTAKELSDAIKKELGFEHNKLKSTNKFVLYSNTQRNIINSWNTVMKQDKFFKTVLDNLDAEAEVRNWNKRQRALVFEDLVETLRVQAAEIISEGNAAQDKSRINSTVYKKLTAYQMKNTYDVDMPSNFAINDDSNRINNIITWGTSDAKNIMRIDLDNNNASFNLTSNLTRAMFGDADLPGSKDTYERRALSRFIDNVLTKDENFQMNGRIKNLQRMISGENANDFHPNEVAREILNVMEQIKEENVTAGILKDVSLKTLDLDKAMVDMLNDNDFLQTFVPMNMKSNRINPIDTATILSKEDGMATFVKQNLMKHYMPNKNEFIKSLGHVTAGQKDLKLLLYDTLYEDISAQLTDMLSIGSKINDADISITGNGEIFLHRKGSAVEIKGVPKVGMENGHLYGMIGQQELNLHLELGYDKNHKGYVTTNIGHKFQDHEYTSRNIKKKIERGEFKVQDFFAYTNKIGEDLREEAIFSGTSGEMLSNYFVGTKEFDKILPYIFAGEDKRLDNDFLDSLDIPIEVKDKLRKNFEKVLSSNDNILPDDFDLDPAIRQELGPYHVNLLRAAADKFNKGQGGEIFRNLVGGLNYSTKDKSKAGKGILMGAHSRFLTGFMNPADENSRPVIGGSGNVIYLRENDVQQATKKAKGLFYSGSLFESEETLYLNKGIFSGVEATTGFTGRTAYVGEIGINAILDFNKDKILRENKVIINQQDQTNKVYDYLYSFLNTFEQAKVFDAEMFDELTGGGLSANKQRLSLSQDFISVLESNGDTGGKTTAEDLWRIKGKIVQTDDGTMAYISSNGKIVKHGDAILNYATYGGTESAWVSKLNKGVLGFEIRNMQNMSLSDKEISDLLNKHKDMFVGIDMSNEEAVMKRFEDVLRAEKLKGSYTIEDINKMTLPKILINESEKSMNQLGYMRIGSVDSTVKEVLTRYSDDTKELIGTTVPTEKALRAFFDDEEKLQKVFADVGIKDMDDFLSRVKKESYVANNLLFGDKGLFKGVLAIGNDNLAGHKNKGSMMTGLLNETIAMLGKYELGQGIENEKSWELGLKSFVKLVNQGTADDVDAYKFFKNAQGKGYNISAVNGHLMLPGGQSLSLGLNDADVIDVSRVEAIVRKVDEIIANKGAAEEDRLVHRFAKVNKDTGEFIYKDGVLQYEDKDTIGRAVFVEDKDGNKIAIGSLGSGTNKLPIESETQSGMSQEYIDVKQRLSDLKAHKQELLDNINGKMTDAQYKDLTQTNFMIEGLEHRASELKTTGHLFEFGDRERNVLNQYRFNDTMWERMEKRVGIDGPRRIHEDFFLENEAMRGLDKEVYSNNYKVFGFLEEELMGQQYFNPYEDKLLTKEMLGSEDYSHLKGVYDDIVTKKGKNLGVQTAQDLYDIRMASMANQFNSKINGGLKVSTMTANDDFVIMSPEQYAKSFGSMGALDSENVVRKNVLIDLGAEFDAMPEWAGNSRYVAVPGMGSILEDADIRKEWHGKASGLVNTYMREYEKLEGQQDQAERQRVLTKMQNQIGAITDSVADYTKKKSLLDKYSKTHIYAAMDRTKIMSLPENKNPLLERAMVHGKSLADWRSKGIYYDAIFDSYEQFEERGFFNSETLQAFGMKDKSEMVEYLQTHGAVMIDDRYPNIRQTSLTTARHYLFMDKEMHSTNASYMTKETLLKMLADSDGDSESRFMLQKGRVSHAMYERHRIMAQDQAKRMSFDDEKAREQWIKSKVMETANIDEETYKAFKGVDIHQGVQAVQINQVYHERALQTNIDDLIKTRKAQMAISNGSSVIAEFEGGQSILGREKLLAVSDDPTFKEVKHNLKKTNQMFDILERNIDSFDPKLKQEILDILPKNNDILNVAGNEINVLDKALYGIEQLGESGKIGKDLVGEIQDNVRQRVRINAYHAESLSKLGISAVGNVNHAFFGANQAVKNYYGIAESSNYNKAKSAILDAMAYEMEQSSISSKKITLKAGKTKVLSLNEILNDIKRTGGSLGAINNEPDSNSLYNQAMQWMREWGDTGKAVAQFENLQAKEDLILPQTHVDFRNRKGQWIDVNKLDPTNKAHAEDIADYMYDFTIRTFAEAYSNEDMRGVANAYSSIASKKASPYAIEKAKGMLDNSFMGQIVYGATGVEPSEIPDSVKKETSKLDDKIEQGYKRLEALNANSTEAAAEAVSKTMKKISKRMNSNIVAGAGSARALTMGVLGLAGGLIAAGYASGNPLNDANPEQVVQQQTQPRMSFGPEAPQMAPNNTGGYIINIKGDTRKGNRQLKKALKQAANSSVGGAVNINMSLRTSQEGGYSNQDIENILSNYF